MYYKYFTIKNFKGIADTTIYFNEDLKIYSLVGLNESGKTTILEAISMLLDSNRFNNQKENLIPRSKIDNFTDSISISTEYKFSESDIDKIKGSFPNIATFPESITLKRSLEYIGSQFKKERTIWCGDFYIKKPKGRKEYKLEAKDDLWQEIIDFIKSEILPEIVYYPNFIFDFPEYIKIKHDYKENPNEYTRILQNILNKINAQNSNGIIESVKKVLSDPLSLDILIDAFENGRNRQVDSILKKMNLLVTKEVLGNWSDLIGVKDKGLSVIFGNIYSEDEAVTINQQAQTVKSYFIEVSIENSISSYNIGQRSLGFRWFFAFVLFTVFRKYQNESKGMLFLLDEPASNLHERGQKKLLDTLAEIVGENSYVLYSTHSHHLIDPKHLSGAYVVINNSDLEEDYLGADVKIECQKYFEFAAHNSHDKSYYQPILKALDYSPSKIEFDDKLVILEGRNDFYTFNYMSKTDEQKKIKFYPGNGATKLDFIIGHYLAWGKDFLVILDDDYEGGNQKKRYLKLFGDILKNKLFTLGDIHKEYSGKVTEDLFIESDKTAIQQIENKDSGSFDKNLFNTSIMHLKLRGEYFNFSSKTKNNFKIVFDFINSKLK